MTRPKTDVPETLHGAMKDFAENHEMTTGEAYILAAKVLINLDSSTDYHPNDDPLLEEFLSRVDE